jgi:hypothetical protein
VTHRELQAWCATLPILTEEERRKAGAGKPKYATSKEEEEALTSTTQLVAVRGRGYRYEINEAISLVQTEAKEQDNSDVCPYADPVYWAGFQIIGW